MGDRINTIAALAAGAVIVVCSLLPAVAGANAARIDFAIGDVTSVDATGKERVVRKGSIIAPGDLIKTGSGRAQLRFSDGSRTALLPGTEFRVDEYEFKGPEDPVEESRSFFSLLKGGLRTITGAIGRLRPRAYRLNTPVATIGIRGTEYLVVLGNSGELRVGAGEIFGENDSGPFSCSGFCFVPDAGSPMRPTEDHPISPPPPPDRPKTSEDPGQSDPAAGFAQVGINSDAQSQTGAPPIEQLPQAPTPDFADGPLYTMAVSLGGDSGGQVGYFAGVDSSELADITFGSPISAFSDGEVSVRRTTASVVDSGSAGADGQNRLGWQAFANGSIEILEDKFLYYYAASGRDGVTCSDGGCSGTLTGTDARGERHHQAFVLAPDPSEVLPADTVLSFGLIGGTTPTIIGFPVGAGDGVKSGSLEIHTSDLTVALSDFRVVAGSGMFDVTVNGWGGFDPSRRFSFAGQGGDQTEDWFLSFGGNLSTKFSHAGMAYLIEHYCCYGSIGGAVGWENTGTSPAAQ